MAMKSSNKRRASRRYPTKWGEWIWSDEHQRNYRHREIAPGDYEYEYQQPSTDTPRHAETASLEPSPLGPVSYHQQQHYTHETVAAPAVDLTQGLTQDSLSIEAYGYGSEPYPDVASYLEGYGVASSSLSATPYSSAPLSVAQAYTSPQSTPSQNRITTNYPSTKTETSDPRYKVHRSSEFKFGRVLRTEPEDTGVGDSDDFTAAATRKKDKYGDNGAAAVRRFVIVTSMRGHSICLPILTYNGQGVNKNGVIAEHHAAIHSSSQPVTFHGEKEKGLLTRSIRVNPNSPDHRLDNASRLNYAQTYDLEHNVKVWFIGSVVGSSEQQLYRDFTRIQTLVPDQHPAEEGDFVKDSSAQHEAVDSSSAHLGYSTPNYSLQYQPSTYGSASTPVLEYAGLSAGYKAGGKAKVVDYDYQPTTNINSARTTDSAADFESTDFHTATGRSSLDQSALLGIKDDDQELGLTSVAERRKADREAEAAGNTNLPETRDLFQKDEPREKDSTALLRGPKDDREMKTAEEEQATSSRLDIRARNVDKIVLATAAKPDLTTGNTVVERRPHIESFSSPSVLAFSEKVQTSVLKAWPSPSAKSSRQALSYDIEWDLQAFVENHVKDPAKLAELVTITGEAVDAEAISSREYLSRTYSDIGTLLSQGIELLLLHNSSFCVQNQEAKLELNLTTDATTGKPEVALVATADFTSQIKLAAAISWMCASFQTSTHAGIMMSSILVSTSESAMTQSKSIRIRQDVLTEPSNESCWHSLFPNRVVAKGFPIRTRSRGIGLELSWNNMAGASRCLSLVEYESGLIAHGLTLILFPMKALDEDNAIQWHLEDKRKQKKYKLARISQVVAASPALRDRFKTLDKDELTGRRCFLGLAERANVVIGTKDYQPVEFFPSWASNAPKAAPIKSHSLTVEAGFPGLFNTQGTHTRSSIPLRSTIQSRQELDIFDILDLGKENLALFFDTTRSIGWLIPKISLALQMTHSIISKYKYPIFDGEYEIPDDRSSVFFANPGPDAATEVADAVRRSLRFRVKKHQYSPSESAFTTFGDMFARTWLMLTDIEQGLEAADGDYRQAGHAAPTYIHGVEFLDAANMKPSMKIKYVKVNQAWAHLTNEHPLVILAREIKPPIVPDTTTLCEPWQLVPPKLSYLVAMGLTISSILQERREGLADGLDWDFRKEIMQSHKPGGKVPVKHTQRLISRGKLRSNSPIRHQMLKYQNGCFVFGKDTDVECKKPIYDGLKAEIGNYAHNGVPHSIVAGARSIDESVQNKSIPRKGTLNDLFSEKQEEILPSKLLEQIGQRSANSGAASTDDYGDLYMLDSEL